MCLFYYYRFIEFSLRVRIETRILEPNYFLSTKNNSLKVSEPLEVTRTRLETLEPLRFNLRIIRKPDIIEILLINGVKHNGNRTIYNRTTKN